MYLTMRAEKKKKVVIVGAGYAGVAATKALSLNAAFMKSAEATLLDSNDYHLLKTELHRVAAGEVPAEKICVPIKAILRGTGVNFRQARAEGVDPVKRIVETSDGDMPYDALLICAGSGPEFYGVPGAEKNSLSLTGLESAMEIKSRFENILKASSGAKKPDPIMIVGAGATGVEMAAYMADRAAREKTSVPILLVEREKTVLGSGRYSRRLLKKVEKQLEKSGVELLTGNRIKKVLKSGAELDPAGKIKTSMIIWTAGTRGGELCSTFGAAPGGRIAAKPDLGVDRYPEIFVAGDSAFFMAGRKPLPCAAQYAIKQGETAAGNIAAFLSGAQTARHAPDQRGEFVSIGGGRAIGWIGIVEMFGPDAQFVKDSILYRYLLRIGPDAVRRHIGL